jgi:hypothetical protein
MTLTEAEFGEELVRRIGPRLGAPLQVESRRSLLYAMSFEDDGRLRLGLNAKGEPIRGGGTGFEQDVLVFEWVSDGVTSIVPRVVIELKFGRVTTHDAIVYSEKARRVKVVYPYARYGLVLGQHKKVPARVLRLGSEFDFIVVVDDDPTAEQEKQLTEILLEEIELSKGMGDVLNGNRPVRSFRRRLEIT